MQQSASAFRLPATGFRRRFSSSLEHARGTLFMVSSKEELLLSCMEHLGLTSW